MTSFNAHAYTARSNARRAARAAGLDPDAIQKTIDGKWMLPAANKPLAEMTEASRYALPTNPQESTRGISPDAGDAIVGIPDFLKVENRVPLTPEQEARLAKSMPQDSHRERVDPRKPKGMSWGEWDAHLAAEASAKRENSLERIAKLKKRPKPVRLPKPRREDAYQPTDVVRVLAAKNPCRPGTAACAIFKKYRDGMTVAQFTKAAQGACPGRLRPIDYLIYDSRKGRIAVGPAAAGKSATAPKKGKKNHEEA